MRTGRSLFLAVAVMSWAVVAGSLLATAQGLGEQSSLDASVQGKKDIAPRFGGSASPSAPSAASSSDASQVPAHTAGETETTIIYGQRSTETITFSGPSDQSGLQMGVAPTTDAYRAREIAEENLKNGTVGAADRTEVAPQVTTQTLIRVDSVVVKSKTGKGQACVQIGVVGQKTQCSDNPQR